jgi:hypothetical protein
MKLSYFKMPELGEDNDWVIITHLEKLSLQRLYVQNHS